MPIFTGINRHTLDKQNRLFVPSKMREELGRDIGSLSRPMATNAFISTPKRSGKKTRKI